MKLGIGSVQFGLDYGISNTTGKVSNAEVKNILEFAGNNNIRLIDTAALYGNSESVLGEALLPQHHFQIVTKTPKFTGNSITQADVKLMQGSLEQSLLNLRQNSIYGLLVHDAANLLNQHGSLLLEAMQQFKAEGLVNKIGISVYTRAQIEACLEAFPNVIEIIQLPINVFDQRLLADNFLTELKKHSIEIHARSVFLQGLLLMEAVQWPDCFASYKPLALAYQQKLRQHNLTSIGAALGFVAGIDEIDHIVCGITSVQQLQEITAQCRPVDKALFQEFAVNDEKLVNPARWQA